MMQSFAGPFPRYSRDSCSAVKWRPLNCVSAFCATGNASGRSARRSERHLVKIEHMATSKTYDVAVIGAGVFGAWTAYLLRRAGRRVALLDAYGPANARASSGGESRLIRMGYGPDELFTRWSVRSLELWSEFFASARQPLFLPDRNLVDQQRRGCLRERHKRNALSRAACRTKFLRAPSLEYRWPQIAFGRASWGLFEPNSGVLLARRAVAAVVQAALQEGVDYFAEAGAVARRRTQNGYVRSAAGDVIRAGEFVFCCGPWLGKVFPNLLWHPHVRHAPGSFLFWRACGEHAVRSARHARLALRRGPVLRNARSRKPRLQNRARSAWRAI